MNAIEAIAPILVVDDNAVNTALYERVIRHIPRREAKCFVDAEDALTWSRTNKVGLLVVDYRMPKLDGVEFIWRFRAMPGKATVPVIMLTSVSSPVLWQMALDAGATTYLAKPINKKRFLETALKLLAQAEAAAGVDG